jgi:CheY-like chemotaxis protein/anti-sigma regulatory factor (Ser/Thr protein kinase)
LQVSLIVKEALKLLRASLPSTIDIRQDILTRRDTVRADPTQIHQVVMNLCTNAAHAMRQEGGELRVVLRDHTGGVSGFGDTDIDLTDDCLEIRVSDTGQGIEPWVQERIFDPFFTTKRQGEGTGMGLSVVHGIVKACCGAITCESTVGQGTTFHVYLPRIDESVEGEKQPDDTDSQVPAGDGERILFVDDEKMIADLAEVALGELGYEVVTTTSSINALALFKEDPDTFDVVITDQTMPGLTGGDLVRRILDFRPDTPVILCTGYSETMTREKARALGVREYLMKPVDYNHLARQLREILAPAAAAQTPPTRRKPPTTTTPVVE